MSGSRRPGVDSSGAAPALTGACPGPSKVLAVATLAAIVALLGLAAVLGPAVVGVASADHDPPETNFTFEPMEPSDRRPGAENIRTGTIGQSAPGVDADLETLLELRSVYSEGSWADCGPSSSEVFGVDRDGDNEPYETDEDLGPYVKRFSAGEDVFVTEFYDENDYGASTYLNSEDRVFAVVECVDNPEEPGWYQIDAASVTGRTADGEEVTFEDPSHYFWICECEDEAEARERLGPPPSEPTPTATAASASSGGDDGGTTTGASSRESTGQETAVGATGTPPGTTTEGTGGTRTATGGSADRAAATVTPAVGDWDRYRVVTPARGDGAGVGPWGAVAALLGGALLWRRGR